MRIAIALALLLVAGHAAAAAPVPLRVAWVTSNDVPLLAFGKPGLARHEGQSYTLELTHFQGAPPMIEAVEAGEIDLLGLGFSSLPIAIQNAGMSDLRVIADLFQDGAPGHYSNEFLVLKDGPIHTIDDLKGHSAATNAAGSAIDMILRAMLRKHGLDPVRDVTILEVAFPNMPAMLEAHKVDLVASLHTVAADPAVRAYARTLFTQRDAIGRSEMAILAARSATLQKDHAAIVDYLEDELRALHWYMDPENHDAAVQLLAKFSRQPASLFQSWAFTEKDDAYHDPQGRPDLDALQANIDTERELGFIKAPLDVRHYADLSYVGEAARRLK